MLSRNPGCALWVFPSAVVCVVTSAPPTWMTGCDPLKVEAAARQHLASLHAIPWSELSIARLDEALTAVSRGAKSRAEVLAWVCDDTDTRPRSFRALCDGLGEEVTAWRAVLLAIPARPRGRQPTRAQVEAIKAGRELHEVSAATTAKIRGGEYYLTRHQARAS